MPNFDPNYGLGMGLNSWFHTYGLLPLLFITFWSLFWKGLALWHAGRRDQPGWFVVLLVVNTVGILELIYLFAVLKLRGSELFTKK